MQLIGDAREGGGEIARSRHLEITTAANRRELPEPGIGCGWFAARRFVLVLVAVRRTREGRRWWHSGDSAVQARGCPEAGQDDPRSERGGGRSAPAATARAAPALQPWTALTSSRSGSADHSAARPTWAGISRCRRQSRARRTCSVTSSRSMRARTSPKVALPARRKLELSLPSGKISTTRRPDSPARALTAARVAFQSRRSVPALADPPEGSRQTLHGEFVNDGGSSRTALLNEQRCARDRLAAAGERTPRRVAHQREVRLDAGAAVDHQHDRQGPGLGASWRTARVAGGRRLSRTSKSPRCKSGTRRPASSSTVA